MLNPKTSINEETVFAITKEREAIMFVKFVNDFTTFKASLHPVKEPDWCVKVWGGSRHKIFNMIDQWNKIQEVS